MKASELRQKTKEELTGLLLDFSRERFNLKMQKGTGQTIKHDRVIKVRRDIARIHTLLTEMASK